MNTALKPENTSLPRYVYEKPEPVCLCACCDKPVYPGNDAIRSRRSNHNPNNYIHRQCFFDWLQEDPEGLFEWANLPTGEAELL